MLNVARWCVQLVTAGRLPWPWKTQHDPFRRINYKVPTSVIRPGDSPSTFDEIYATASKNTIQDLLHFPKLGHLLIEFDLLLSCEFLPAVRWRNGRIEAVEKLPHLR